MTFDERIRRNIDGQAHETVTGSKVEWRACEQDDDSQEWVEAESQYAADTAYNRVHLPELLKKAKASVDGYSMHLCYEIKEGQWRIVPQYTRSLDTAMLLHKEGWQWDLIQYGDRVEARILEERSNKAYPQLIAVVTMELKYFPNWIEACAMTRTLCALQALGLEIKLR